VEVVVDLERGGRPVKQDRPAAAEKLDVAGALGEKGQKPLQEAKLPAEPGDGD
jgi:hypothetical protein